MIIQCPNCETKFSLPTESLRGSSEPKFHCSRCDFIFSLAEADTEFVQPELAGAEEPAEEDDQTFNADSELEAEEAPGRENREQNDEIAPGTQLELLPENLPRLPSAGRIVESLIGEDETPLITAPWPDQNTGREYEADMRKALSKRLESSSAGCSPSWATARAIVEARNEEAVKPINFMSAERNPAFEPIEPAAAQPSELSAADISESGGGKAESLKRALGAAFSAKEQTLSAKDLIDDLEAPGWTAESSFLPDFDADFDELDEQELIARLDSAAGFGTAVGRVALATALPAVFCCCLWLFGSYLLQTPQIADAMLTLSERELPTPAPRGVSISSLAPHFVSLDDGREVVEISGVLLNRTSSKFNSVKIEASLYDKRNRPIDRIIVHADNALTNASRLASLGQDDINSLQAKRGSENYLLNPADQQQFRVVFTNDVSEAAWFSANIYSVTAPEPA